MTTMTSHLDEGMLLAYVDGELPAAERAETERHLDACEACRAELGALSSASRALADALGLLDHRVPQTAPPRRAPRAAPRPTARAGGGWGALPRAAVLVLGFAAAASATIPGSPVRGWLERVLGDAPAIETAARTAAPPAEEVATLAAPEAGPEAGVSVEPVDGRVAVVLRDASPELQVRATLVDGPRAGVYASGAAAAARFDTGAGRIEVVGAGAGELRIELPRAAAEASVTVNGRPYLSKRGGELHLSMPGGDTSAAEITFRPRP